MEEGRSQTLNLDSESSRGPPEPSKQGSTAFTTGREGPHSEPGHTAGARDENSFDSNDSEPLFGYTSNRMPIFPNFNPNSINHMGDSTVPNTDENQRRRR